MPRRRIAWAVWLIAAALLWLFENNAATLALLIASALLPLASILSARLSLRRIKLALSAPQAEKQGFSQGVVLSARGIGLFSRVAGRLICENRLTRETAEVSFSLSPRISGETSLKLAADTAHCGVLRLRAEAWSEDFFGLWRSEFIDCEAEYITARPGLFLPQVTLSENAWVSAESERFSQTSPGFDPSETFAIREYIPGDPIRQIHWKLSQKTDRLMLRELGLSVASETLLVFRNVLAKGEAVSPEAADAMAEVFLSISRALAAEGLTHTAAFAENGQYFLSEIQNEADYRAMEARFLALSWEFDSGGLARLLAAAPYAHVAIISAAMPSEAEGFTRDRRVTVLTASDTEAVPGVYKLPFSAGGYREELQFIEL